MKKTRLLLLICSSLSLSIVEAGRKTRVHPFRFHYGKYSSKTCRCCTPEQPKLSKAEEPPPTPARVVAPTPKAVAVVSLSRLLQPSGRSTPYPYCDVCTDRLSKEDVSWRYKLAKKEEDIPLPGAVVD